MIPRNVLPTRKTVEQLAFTYAIKLAKMKVAATREDILAAIRHQGTPSNLLEEVVASWLENDRRTGVEIVD